MKNKLEHFNPLNPLKVPRKIEDKLLNAIKENKKDKVRGILADYPNLLYQRKNPLALSLTYYALEHTTALGIVENGLLSFLAWAEKITLEELKGLLSQFHVIDDSQNKIIKQFEKQIEPYDYRLKIDEVLAKDDLSEKILSILKNCEWDTLDMAKTLDQFLTMRSIFNIIDSELSMSEKRETLIKFLILRENVLRGDSLDYCNTLSQANYLCAQIADILYPEERSALNTLLIDATTNTNYRKEPWLNPITMTNDLPKNPGSLFRSEDNRIHLYNNFVDQAIENLKLGCNKLHTVFLKTDRYPDEPISLSLSDINIIRKRSPHLKQLIEYVERLEKNYANEQGIYDRFVALRAALLQGDYAHNGKDLSAGKEANIEIAKFAEWWSDLGKTKTGIELKEQIQAIDTGNLGNIINIILDIDTDDRNNPKYCIFLKGNLLGEILNIEANKDALSSLDKNIEWRLESEALDEIAKKIKEDVENTQPRLKTSKNIFKAIYKNKPFRKNILEDQSVDYRTLFHAPTKKLLTITSKAGLRKESVLYHAVKKNAGEEFITYLLTYHISQFGEDALNLIIKMLYAQQNFNPIKLIIESTNYNYEYTLTRLVKSELKKDTSKDTIDVNGLKLLHHYLKNPSLFQIEPLLYQLLSKENYEDAKDVIKVFNFDLQKKSDELFAVLACNPNNHEKFTFYYWLFSIEPKFLFNDAAANIFEEYYNFIKSAIPLEHVQLAAGNAKLITMPLSGQDNILTIAAKNNRPDIVKYLIDNHFDQYPAKSLMELSIFLFKNNQRDLSGYIFQKWTTNFENQSNASIIEIMALFQKECRHSIQVLFKKLCLKLAADHSTLTVDEAKTLLTLALTIEELDADQKKQMKEWCTAPVLQNITINLFHLKMINQEIFDFLLKNKLTLLPVPCIHQFFKDVVNNTDRFYKLNYYADLNFILTDRAFCANLPDHSIFFDIFKRMVEKEYIDDTLLINFVNFFGTIFLTTMTQFAEKTNSTAYGLLLKNYSSCYSIDEVKKFFKTVSMNCRNIDVFKELIRIRTNKELHDLLNTCLTSKPPKLDIVSLITDHLSLMSDDEFLVFLNSITTDHQQLLDYFITHEEFLMQDNGSNKRLFTSEQLSRLKAIQSGICVIPSPPSENKLPKADATTQTSEATPEINIPFHYSKTLTTDWNRPEYLQFFTNMMEYIKPEPFQKEKDAAIQLIPALFAEAEIIKGILIKNGVSSNSKFFPTKSQELKQRIETFNESIYRTIEDYTSHLFRDTHLPDRNQLNSLVELCDMNKHFRWQISPPVQCRPLYRADNRYL